MSIPVYPKGTFDLTNSKVVKNQSLMDAFASESKEAFEQAIAYFDNGMKRAFDAHRNNWDGWITACTELIAKFDGSALSVGEHTAAIRHFNDSTSALSQLVFVTPFRPPRKS
jgi:hypothetical protein